MIENIDLVLNAIAEIIEDIEDLRDLKQVIEESKDEPDVSFEEVQQMFNLS